MDNRIILSKKEINEILEIIRNKDNKKFIFIDRDIDSGKNPRSFMVELGIDMNDAINIIKSLEIKDYYECLLDRKNEYIYLYVLKKEIEGVLTYIKIGFLHDKKTGNVCIVSFHKDMEV